MGYVIRFMVLTLLVLMITTSYASQKAITDTGDEVFLYKDGTWKYFKKKLDNKPIETNENKFKKSENASFLLKSIRNKSAYWINTSKWTFAKASENDDSREYEFKLKGVELWGSSITESWPIPFETLANFALENARKVAPDIEFVKKEYRYVNGNKVIYLDMRGTTSADYGNVPLSYFGYYHSDDSGSTQFVAYTSTNSVDKYKAEINDFLNGLTTQKSDPADK